MDAHTTPDGRTVYVADDEGERGTKGSFLVTYVSPDRERRHGWFCANCESTDVAMDTMGRIECDDCGNFKKPDEWDPAHE